MSTWYRQGDVNELGPFSLEELQYLMARGQLQPGDLVRNVRASEWIPAESVDSLFTDGTIPLADALRPVPLPGWADTVETKAHDTGTPPVADIAPETEIEPLQPVVQGTGELELSDDIEENETWKRVAIGSSIGIVLVLLILLLIWLLLFSGSRLSDSNGEGGGLADASGAGDGTGESGGEVNSQSQGNVSTGTSGVTQNKPAPAAQPESEDYKPLPEDKVTIKRIDVTTKPPASKPRKGGGGGGQGNGIGGAGGARGGSEFFGVRARGNKFVYVVDCSGSMRGQPFQKACDELLTSINGLKRRQMFYVFFFSNGTYRMFNQSELKLLNANEANKERIAEWVNNFQGGGGTSPRDAMLQALDLKPDVIFLLSDGAFQDRTEVAVENKNEKKVMINTIGFMHRGGELMLKKIANENRGEYRFVP